MLASSDWIVEQLAAALAWDGKPDVRWLDHFWTDMTAGATRVDAWPAVTAVLRGAGASPTPGHCKPSAASVPSGPSQLR